MQNARAEDTDGRGRRSEWLGALLGLLVLGCLGAGVWTRLGPPAVISRDAAPELFSAERARVHLDRIARVPHPSGSPAARAVEAYLVESLEALGLVVEVQAAPACTDMAGLRRCGHVRNVVATLPGLSSSGAVLLSAHYDSVPNAPGAGDDGAAVAALLETARALKHAGPIQRDVMFAFLDGEEDLLLGSAAFCRTSGALRRVRLVANFDARGSRGAVTLIGASPGSAAVVGQLLGEVRHPVLNSFYPSVARVLPNATDAEIYERCGLETVSFAFADGFENYHQASDDPEHLDERSLQHHGDYALGIARRFALGGAVEPSPDAGELVFFDVGALGVVSYPALMARLLAVALAAATCRLLYGRIRVERTRLRDLVAAAAAFGAALLLAVLGGAVVVRLVVSGWRFWAGHVHAAALAACAACFVAAGYLLLVAYLERRSRGELCVTGPLVVWVGAACLTAVFVPGMSHLFTWPAAALLVGFFWRGRAGVGAAMIRWASLLPAVLFITPVIYTLVVVAGAGGASGAMLFVVLLLGAGAGQLSLLVRRARRAALVLALAGVGIGVALRVEVGARPGPPTGNTIDYALDTQSQRAFWLSADGYEDGFKRQFLGSQPERSWFEAFRSDVPLLAAPAPARALPAPVLELLSDTWLAGERRIILRARSRRAARTLDIWETTGVELESYTLDGSEPMPLVRFTPELDRKLLRLLTGTHDDGRWGLRLFAAPAEGSMLTLTTRHEGPLELRVSDLTKGLEVLPEGFVPRSGDWTEGYPGDHTRVSAPPLSLGERPRPSL